MSEILNIPNLPIWVIISLLLLAQTKDLWLGILPDGFKKWYESKVEDSRHTRELEQAKVDYELQKKIADEAQEQLKDAQFNRYFERLMQLVEETVLNGQNRLGERLGEVEQALQRNRRGLLEMAGLLGALYSKAQKENGKLVLDVIQGVDDILDGVDERSKT